MLRRCGCLIFLMVAGLSAKGSAQSSPASPRRLVIATGPAITNIVPTLTRASAAMQASDLVFLRLGRYGGTSFGDHAAVPELAKGWTRRDSLTIAFDLDPRARWHDGRPVTARDVVYSFTRARDPKQSPSTAMLLVEVASVQAEGDGRVVIRFARAYGEQLYDATFHVQILPEHLVAAIPADSLASSAFVRAPVGTGPYRWDRLEPADYLQLRSVPDFFLGTPAIEQMVWRFTTSHETRLGMLLSGEADVQEDIMPPVSNLSRLSERPSLRVAHFPSLAVNYLLFNERTPGDTARPHPLFADAGMRRAITLGIDRATIAKAIFGKYATLISSPAAPAVWFGALAPPVVSYDPKQAARLLTERGWKDSDGDGILDRNGVPLAFTLLVTSSSEARKQMALIIQAQLKRLGVRVEVVPVDFTQFGSRRPQGNFDASLESYGGDPSPWSLLDRWGCGASANFGRYCNRTADSLLRAAHLARKDPAPPIRGWLRTVADDYPAAFLFTVDRVYAIPKAYGNVNFQVESPWERVWTWTLPGAGR
jgi:peptide/nickel transport system substrate-binding protein